MCILKLFKKKTIPYYEFNMHTGKSKEIDMKSIPKDKIIKISKKELKKHCKMVEKVLRENNI